MASPQHMQLFRQIQQQQQHQQQQPAPFHGQFPPHNAAGQGHNVASSKQVNGHNNIMEPPSSAGAAHQNNNQQVIPFPQASTHLNNHHQAGNNMMGHNINPVLEKNPAFLVDSKPVITLKCHLVLS